LQVWGVGNVNRFRGGLVFKAHRLCVSLNSRREINKEEGYSPPLSFSKKISRTRLEDTITKSTACAVFLKNFVGPCRTDDVG